LNRNHIHEIQVVIPPLPEQRAIAGVLSSLDDKIDLLHWQNKTLEGMAEALWRKMFVEDADPRWRKGKLGDYITVKGGTTPSTKILEYWNGDICWTSPRDLSGNNQVFLHDTEKKITQSGLKQIGSGLLPIGSVLLSSRAPIGYLTISNIPVAINQGYIAIICDGHFSNYYMYLWIKANIELIIGSANGSTFLEISKSTFKDLEVEVPSESDVQRFNLSIKPLFEKILANEKQIRTLSRLRDTLLPRLMSGEVRVKLNN
jgi:type I restriction enzyme, S subunit